MTGPNTTDLRVSIAAAAFFRGARDARAAREREGKRAAGTEESGALATAPDSSDTTASP